MGLVIFAVCVLATIGIWRDFIPSHAKEKLRLLLIILPIAMTFGILWLFGNVTPQAKAQKVLAEAVNAVDAGETRKAIAILQDANESRHIWEGEAPIEREYGRGP